MHLNSPPLASVGGKTLTESTRRQDTPALTSRTYTGVLPSYQSVSQPATQLVGSPSSSMPIYWQGYNGTSGGISHASQQPIPFQPPSTGSFPLTMQGQWQAPEIQTPTTLSLPNTSEFGTPVSSYIASASVHPKYLPSTSPVQSSTSLDIPSFLSTKSSLPHSESLTANRSTVSSFPLSREDLNTSENQIVGKAVSDSQSILPVQSTSYTSSFADSSGPLLTPPPSLLTPDQLAQSRPHALSSRQKLYPVQTDMSAPIPTSSYSSSSFSIPVSQAPLLPLPTSARQVKFSLSLSLFFGGGDAGVKNYNSHFLGYFLVTMVSCTI